MSADVLLARLEGVKGRNGTWRARCPAHGSRGGTLAIREEPDGRVLMRCHAGCSNAEILTKIGLCWDELFPRRLTDDRLPRIKKPWRASDVVKALKFELHVCFIILADVAAGRDISATDRQRAGVAMQRISLFIEELENAA